MGHASQGVSGIYGSRELYALLIKRFDLISHEGIDEEALVAAFEAAEAQRITRRAEPRRT